MGWRTSIPTTRTHSGLLRLGTRGSALARAQAALVHEALVGRHPALRVETVYIRTSGDRGEREARAPAGLKGLFVKEIEDALLAGEIDVGVHSLKDLPARLPAGLVVGAVPARALECRADAAATRALLATVEDRAAATAVAAERAFLLAIGGDCNTPLAAHATVADGRVTLRALVTDQDERRWLEEAGSAPAADAEALGRALAEGLLVAGAREILGG